MKKLILSLSLSGLVSPAIFACPFCGCGNSNFQVGLLPTYSSAFIGIRYTYSHFNTLSTDGTQFSHDYFHTTEIWGGYKIGKIQVMGFVPYVKSHKLSDDGDINVSGLGDILLIANYQLFSVTHTTSENHKTVSHSLWMGGGVKFHTGHSLVNVNDADFTVGDFTSTPGTGSTDYLLMVTHNLFVGNNGVVTNVAYRINTVNAQQFQYGNRSYLNAAFFHSFTAGRNIIRPSIGLNFVANGTNRYQGLGVEGSHGYIASGMAGINLQRGKIGLLANGFLPVAQDLYQHQTRFRERASLSLTLSI